MAVKKYPDLFASFVNLGPSDKILHISLSSLHDDKIKL